MTAPSTTTSNHHHHRNPDQHRRHHRHNNLRQPPPKLPPFLLLLLLGTAAFLLLITLPAAVEAGGCNDRDCLHSIYKLEEELDSVRRKNDGLNRDKKHLMDDINMMISGLAEEKMARDSARETMLELRKEVQYLKDRLEARKKASGKQDEEPVCDKNTQECPGDGR